MFGKKKYSPKVKAQSRQWLQQNGCVLEQLTEPQQEELYKLTKTKRSFLWLLPISLIMFFIYSGLVFWGVRLMSEMKIDFTPTYYVTERADGEKETKEIPIEIQDSFKTYGNLLVICGLFGGGLIYSWLSLIIAPITSYFIYRRQKRMMLVFLPLAKSEEINEVF